MRHCRNRDNVKFSSLKVLAGGWDLLDLWFATVTLLPLVKPAVAAFRNTDQVRRGRLVFQAHSSSTNDQRLKVFGTAAAESGGATKEWQRGQPSRKKLFDQHSETVFICETEHFVNMNWDVHHF